MSIYSKIDPIISDWAETNAIVWLTEYQDAEVRTFFVNTDSKARVQIWIDSPEMDHVTVHICRNKVGLNPKKIEEFSVGVAELSALLDAALKIARDWAIS